MASLSQTMKGLAWTFAHDDNDNIFVFRNGKRLKIKAYTPPRVADLQLATEEMLKMSSLDLPISDAIVIVFEDNRKVVLRVSNFDFKASNFSRNFESSSKLGASSFLTVFRNLTAENTDLDETFQENTFLSQMSIPDIDSRQPSASKKSTTEKRANLPPMISNYEQSNEKHPEADSIEQKVLEGTYRIKLENIVDAPDRIRFRDIDEGFVKEMKDSMAKGTIAPQPLAIMVQDEHFNENDIMTYEFVCLGGNHLRKAYQMTEKSHADCKVYVNLTDEEALRVAKDHNDVGHYIRKMSNLELILLLRRQLFSGTCINDNQKERVNDLTVIKSWRNRISKILPREKNIKSIQPLLNIAMCHEALYKKVLQIYEMYGKGQLKDQKAKKTSSDLNSTSVWKAMMTVDDDTSAVLCEKVVTKDWSLHELQKKFEEIKNFRKLQQKIVDKHNVTWDEAVDLFYNGNKDDAETSLYPYLGKPDSEEFVNYIEKMKCEGSKTMVVKDIKPADFIFLAKDEIKESTIREIHSKNIGKAKSKYSMCSFDNIKDEAEKVAEYSYGRIAIIQNDRKRSENEFAEVQMLFIAQYGTRTVTTLPGQAAKQLFNITNNDYSEIFQLFCNPFTDVLVMDTKNTNVIQSLRKVECSLFAMVRNNQEKRNLKRKFDSIEEE